MTRGAMVAAIVAGAALAAWAAELVPPGTSAARVQVTKIEHAGGTIRGELVNETGQEVSDVRLLITETFYWTDERHPGPDDPSDGRVVTIPGAIPPGGRLEFSTPFRPRPARDDGRFALRIQVLGMKQRPIWYPEDDDSDSSASDDG